MPKAKKPVKKSTTKVSRKITRPAKSERAPKSKKLSKKEMNFFKGLLMELRKKIAGELSSIEGDTLNTTRRDASGELSGYNTHTADLGSDNYDRELNIGLASNEQQILNDIDVALKRIEEGTYGICEITGSSIPKKRLLAMPYTRLSKKAQEEEEKNKRRS